MGWKRWEFKTINDHDLNKFWGIRNNWWLNLMWENEEDEECNEKFQMEINKEESSEVRMRELENFNWKCELESGWLWKKGLMIKYSSIKSSSQGTSMRSNNPRSIITPDLSSVERDQISWGANHFFYWKIWGKVFTSRDFIPLEAW